MALILQIPTQPADNLGASVYQLTEISKLVNESNETDIIIDFSKTKFQFSCFLAGLFILSKDWVLSGKNVKIGSINAKIITYLNFVNFHKGFILSADNNLGYYFHGKTYTPICVFPTNSNERDACIQTVLDIIYDQTKIKDSDCKNTIAFFLTELTNNVADHSDSDSGIVFVQSYKDKGFMDITIADAGRGILSSYSKTTKFNPRNEVEAIEMAVNGYSTKNLAETRGFGISRSRDLLVNGFSGRFCLWSGENMFIHTTDIKEIIKVGGGAKLNGCYLNLRLPLNTSLRGNFYDYMD